MRLLRFVWLLLFALCLPTFVEAQQWAKDMFVEMTHDFGNVSRGSKPQFRFVFENKYKEDVHVASVRSSCGCTTPSVEKELLKSREKSAIVAALNTVAFSGDKNSVITVVFDRPFFAEVQLSIKGRIRSEIVVSPPELDFGRLNEGQSKDVTVTVTYAGRTDWQIKDVVSQYEHVAVTLGKADRQAGTTKYSLQVQLKDDAPVGAFTQQLSIVTNDPVAPSFAVEMRGEVLPILSLSPASFNIGKVKAGQKVQQKLVVKGPTPFSITKVSDGTDRLTCVLPEGKKNLHLLDITYEAGTDAGALNRTVRIETDLEGGRCAECLLVGEIEASDVKADAP